MQQPLWQPLWQPQDPHEQHSQWLVMGVREASGHLEKHSILCYFVSHCRYYLSEEQIEAEHVSLDVFQSSEQLSKDVVCQGEGIGQGAHFVLP